MYVTIETFRRYQNKQGILRNELNDNAYYVYIIHVVVLGGLALIMLNTAIPSLAKHLILTVSTFVMSNLIVSVFRKASASALSRIHVSQLGDLLPLRLKVSRR